MYKIGTSGYSFQDWIGNFYPMDYPKNKMFDYYTKIFDTVEINSTYYNIPNYKVFYHLNNKCEEKFEFIVKANQETTHKRNKNKESLTELLKSLQPIIESNKLKGILAQFPFSFKYSKKNLEYVKETNDYLSEIPLIVEFRHNSWLNDETFKTFIENNITFVCVDEPALPNMIPKIEVITSAIGYIRFHGRNNKTWYDTSKGDRYDYLYNEDELRDWIEIAKKMNTKVSTVYLIFNNCHKGSAPLNAQMVKKMLKQG